MCSTHSMCLYARILVQRTPWTRNVCSGDKEKESGLGLALKVGEWWKTSDTPVPYIQTCTQCTPPSMHIYMCHIALSHT